MPLEFIQITLFLALFATFLFVLFQKKPFVNGTTVVGISVLGFLIGAESLYMQGMAVDALNGSGSVPAFILFLMTAGLCLVNPVLYFRLWELKVDKQITPSQR
ncbi:hypothetical protein LCM20_06315 [Halobacillus litoralis]|uniref:hypothetical protein n=1 Tax=Halobacillus litoralis TaxID=45668 RepID=UPI001CD2E58A|nr:hypothetical protein [Halobacillus litoralis]MCA0970194.1 hypothetical protein [Halobacillus litoralis]